MPDSLVDATFLAGTPDEVTRRIQRYRDAGVRLPIVRPAAAHQIRRVVDLLSPR